MIASRLNRSLLLAFIPVIAFLIYFEGQKYDPALIRFTASDFSAGAESTLFPQSIGEFRRQGPVRIYSKENLYEYVNGHAEYFLSAGFVRLVVGEYMRSGTEPSQPDIVVDIYDMGKEIQAFGVLSDEIGEYASTVRIGMMGAKTDQGISFISGKYYVKITSFQGAVPLDTFAQQIDRLIGSSSGEITMFSRLPDLEEVVTTRYIKEAYRGIDFANNVIEREYRIQEKTIQVSLMTGTDTKIKELVASYLAFFRESDTPYEQTSRDGKDLYKIMDPYEGDWYLIPFSDSLFGIYGAADEEVLKQFLSSMSALAAGKE